MSRTTYIAIFPILFFQIEAAKILAISPVPSLNHRELFQPLVDELAKRGHEVTFISTKSAYPDGGRPENLKEIDLENVSFSIWQDQIPLTQDGMGNYPYEGVKAIVDVLPKVFEAQMKDAAVQKLIATEEPYDLLLLHAWSRPSMVWSHIYKVPVIKISPSGMFLDNPTTFGAPSHPILYPAITHQRIYNLTFFEKLTELYKGYHLEKLYSGKEKDDDEIVRKIFGPDVPPLRNLQENADMLMLNSNSFWERNRPLPRNVVYFGQMRQKPAMELSQDIKSFLDSSEGAIFMDFGTNLLPSKLSPSTVKIFLRVFSKLPYRVLWQFEDTDKVLEGTPDNVMIRKWFSQSDVFRHPNLKLIITNGGTQTVQAAIEAGVPVIGLPRVLDQRLNVEHCVQYGFGLQLDIENIDEELLWSSVMKVIENLSYRQNIIKFRTLIDDTPISPIDRAILWTEYVLKYSDTSILRSPAANLTFAEYFEVELIIIVVCSFVMFLMFMWLSFKLLLKKIDDMLASQATIEVN